ncbi:MAG: cytochrome B, partial [Rhodoferax sp.]|nr:cytochrome B [Rhodoferax sp.]
KTYGKFALIALIVLHLLAIAYYYFAKRNNLVKPMIDGDKSVAGASVPGSRDDAVSRLAAAVVLAACAGLVAWGVSLGS